MIKRREKQYPAAGVGKGRRPRWEYYVGHGYSGWYDINGLLKIPECVVKDKKVLITRLRAAAKEESPNFQTVWDCITIKVGPVGNAGRNMKIENRRNCRKVDLTLNNLMKVGSESSNVR